jgi:hypothetical protein
MNGKPTIEAIQPMPAGVVMGQRNGLSPTDYFELNKLYKCTGVNGARM